MWRLFIGAAEGLIEFLGLDKMVYQLLGEAVESEAVELLNSRVMGTMFGRGSATTKRDDSDKERSFSVKAPWVNAGLSYNAYLLGLEYLRFYGARSKDDLIIPSASEVYEGDLPIPSSENNRTLANLSLKNKQALYEPVLRPNLPVARIERALALSDFTSIEADRVYFWLRKIVTGPAVRQYHQTNKHSLMEPPVSWAPTEWPDQTVPWLGKDPGLRLNDSIEEYDYFPRAILNIAERGLQACSDYVKGTITASQYADFTFSLSSEVSDLFKRFEQFINGYSEGTQAKLFRHMAIPKSNRFDRRIPYGGNEPRRREKIIIPGDKPQRF